MKAFTDLEQSKKLAEILPTESADMCWTNHYYGHIRSSMTAASKTIEEYKKLLRGVADSTNADVFYPCWSLAALLDIFPCSKESPIVNLTRGGWNPSFTRRWFATWEDEDKNIFYSSNGASPVDAVVELIMKLHEQNVL